MPVKSIERKREIAKEYRIRIKRTCFEHYGTGLAMCSEPGCFETDLSCLELHHKDGGGNADRAEKIGRGLRSCGGWHFYLVLKQLGYPEGYVVLCTRHHDVKHGRTPKRHRVYKLPPAEDKAHLDDVIPF